MTYETGLESEDGDAVSLQSVHIEGTLKGLMLSVTTKQHYVNKSRRNIEAVYTFPLPAHAVLLGTKLTIGGKTLTAVVMEKTEAEEDYEEAIQEGDMPVMVERSGPGLYTANLGNLKRGEEVVIEVQWALLLNVRDDRVRLAIPTVMGARYGDAHLQNALAPHQSDEVNMLAEYPLTLVLAIEGEIARATIDCASHDAQISSSESEDGPLQVVSIISDAYMDRDVVITLSDLPNKQFGMSQISGDGSTTTLASFCPELPTSASSLALKILVDCSGSMQGDSIAQAKEAVHQVLQQLTDADYVSYSRFGGEVVHNFNGPLSANDERISIPESMLPANSAKLANIGRLIRGTNANMGGTEMQTALISTIRDLQLPKEAKADSFVPTLLLITDGNIWDHHGVVRAAKTSGHRIFAIGVGSAPVESLLREMAETTGGACEFVTPNESMAKIALSLVMRMRTAKAAQLSVNWGEPPTWQSALPTAVFDRETIHVFATFANTPSSLPALTAQIEGSSTCTALSKIDSGAENLDRIAAFQRLQTEPTETALKTAMQYSLVTQQTNLLLVHVREKEDKTTELPTLEHVKQMMAAGHSGFGSVARSDRIFACLAPPAMSRNLNAYQSSVGDVRFSSPIAESYDQPTWLRNPKSGSNRKDEMTETGMDHLNIPDFLRRQAEQKFAIDTMPEQLIHLFNLVSLTTNIYKEALDFVMGELTGAEIKKVVKDLTDLLGDQYKALTILLFWISEVRMLDECRLQRHAIRLLDASYKNGITPDTIRVGYEYLLGSMKHIAKDGWNLEQLSSA